MIAIQETVLVNPCAVCCITIIVRKWTARLGRWRQCPTALGEGPRAVAARMDSEAPEPDDMIGHKKFQTDSGGYQG